MRGYLVLSMALTLMSCASEAPVDTSSQGAPRIDRAAIQDHAEQFETDVPVREPGSQEELAAASYILGHLQRAGYVPLLDSVPVGDLVESTNVVALPVGGDEPTALVAVSYGTAGAAAGGESIGAFLELARSLMVVDPDHTVAFVALGAEEAPRLGGSLGTRRLLQYLDDEDLAPHVITLSMGTSLTASGARAAEVIEAAGRGAVSDEPREDLFERLRLEHTSVSGPPEQVGTALLKYLGD